MSAPPTPPTRNMHPTIRSALVLLGGVIVSVLVVILVDTVIGMLYPLPRYQG